MLAGGPEQLDGLKFSLANAMKDVRRRRRRRRGTLELAGGV
jgi:hypothetical protein